MVRTIQSIIVLSGFLLTSLSVAHAQENITNCLSCKDTQHAANLAAIEKRLMQANDDSLQSMNKEARSWYSKFQEGGWLFDGWQEISDNVVAKVPQENKIKTKVTMQSLGVKIGCEWSKENAVRKISTEMLKDWGKRLRKSVSDSPDNLVVVINSIESEVNELLF
jgi:hypothetical protein